MTRYQPKSDKIKRIPLPLPIPEHHKDVQLYINFLFVNGYPIIANKPEKLNSVTAHTFKSKPTARIKTVLDMVIDKYDAHGFNVTIIYRDNEFNIATLKEYLLPILV